jgi:two-component system phosphate regulon sensor histidine kinase PhoR
VSILTLRTPRQVATASATLITIVLAISYFLTIYILEKEFQWLWLMVLVILGFIITFSVVYLFIERFLYRKVKIIYRTIHTLRSHADGTPRIQMSSDVLSDVQNEVAEWAQEKIKEIKELRKAESYRREFIGNLAHELKTPVFNMQGYIGTLLDSGLDDAELTRKFLERAERSADRMAHLITDLDQITSIESGEMPLDIVRFDVVALTKNVMDHLEHSATAKNIRIRLHMANEGAIFVEADRKRIEQVFTNLLINSINYGREHGQTRVHFFDMVDNVLIEIADNGIGISKEHLPRVFERFYRVDKSRSRDEGGSGLGLAICKHILDAHHQNISVRSTENVGSTFSFTLKKAASKGF